MKAKIFFGVFAFTLAVLLLSTWTASAQGPKPTPTPARRSVPSQVIADPPVQEPSMPDTTSRITRVGDDARPSSRAPLVPSSPSSARRPRVTPGQPGLSYAYAQTFGVTESAYPSPGTSLVNDPAGLFIDASNNVYVAEARGYRALKYNSAGTNQLALGVDGLCGSRNNPTGFCTPQDIAVSTFDAAGNFWLAEDSRVVQYNSSGTFLQQLPVLDANGKWSSGSDTTHFNSVGGIIFDNIVGRMFVSDMNNNRVQVYSYSGSGSPTYSATITGFNSPRRLALDGSSRLYVTDRNNNRIQRCTLSGTWTCSTFVSGLNRPQGIAVDASFAYIADGNNFRVQKCDLTTSTCSTLISGMSGTAFDVALDSLGNIYTTSYTGAAVKKYNSAGTFLGNFVGTDYLPYNVDATRINRPWGIAIGSDNSIYITEQNGNRLLKLNSTGAQQWTFGQAGVAGSDTAHFNQPEGKPAIASNGNVYVSDSGNNRILVLNASSGAYVSSFGSYGTTGNDKFNWPGGIGISPVNSDIYITDYNNHRIQVYDSSLVYKTTIGVTGVITTSNTGFNYPRDVAIAQDGSVFVADRNNHRVQKCTLSGLTYSCSTFAGTTGTSGSNFDFLNGPVAVTIDSVGRVYVAEENNNRVQVFDSTGAYLTTIGGASGNNTGRLRNASGVALDSSGNIYVTDRTNSRVQKFTPGVSGWTQVNLNGFTDRNNSNLHTLTPFGGQLYAGTFNSAGNGAQMWRMSGANSWAQAITAGFGITQNIGINHLHAFNSQLYAGVRNDTAGGSIYRSADGNTWTPVVTGGFTDTLNAAIYRFATFNNQIYAGTGIFTTTHGGEIWRSSSGDNGSWSLVVGNGFDHPNNYIIRTSEVYSGNLYFGTQNLDMSTGMTTTGAIIIRSDSGNSGSWSKVINNGFGDINNMSIGSLVSFNGYLYASTARWDWSGVQVWRCQICAGQGDWTKVVDNGFGNINNYGTSTLQVFNGQLYLVIGNGITGMEVWRSATGNSGAWTQTISGGFGDSNNAAPYFNNVTVFNNALYTGTNNGANGVEVWQTQNPQYYYLPMILK